jgi:signal transduction histidine kinase
MTIDTAPVAAEAKASAMAPAPAPAATSATVPRDRSYGAAWRAAPRRLGYLIPTFPIAIAVTTLLSTLFSTGVSMLVIVVGLFVLAAALYIARFAGTLEVIRLRWSGERPIVEPDWRIDPAMPLWRKLLYPFANGRYWLSLLHGTIVAPVIATLSFVALTLWFALMAVSVAAPIRLALVGDEALLGLLGRNLGDPEPAWLAAAAPALTAAAIALGVIAILTLPYLLRGLTWLHGAVARPFLGRFKSEQLEAQVSSLFSSRQAAVAAEGSALRRIERDIHDGPQQRLIRLQMDLAAAERRLATHPDEAAGLIQDARRQAQDALDELRNLSRGFAPPLLLDRGLFAALESLATRSSIPVTLETELGATANLPDEVARNAYFVASELIANAAKHSQASTITLSVTTGDGALVVAVTDDGIGGAIEKAGHGLAGLRDRAAGLGGTLDLLSPEGGPTSVRVTLPMAGVGAASGAASAPTA